MATTAPEIRQCVVCGYVGPMGTWLRNYNLPQLIAVIGLLFYFIPGVIFIAWAWGKQKCPRCGALDRSFVASPNRLTETPQQEVIEPVEEREGYDYRAINRERKRLFGQHADLVAALIFVARADGRLTAKDRDILIGIISELADETQIPPHFLENDLKKADRLKAEDFETSLQNIGNSGEEETNRFLNGYIALVGNKKDLGPGLTYCRDKVLAIFGKAE